MDITGDGGMEFFTNRIKVTTKWPVVRSMPDAEDAGADAANFAGQM